MCVQQAQNGGVASACAWRRQTRHKGRGWKGGRLQGKGSCVTSTGWTVQPVLLQMHQSNPYLSHTVADCLGDACSSVGVVTQESNNIVTSLCQFNILIVVVSTLVVLWGGVTAVGLVTHQVMVVTHVHLDPQLHTHTRASSTPSSFATSTVQPSVLMPSPKMISNSAVSNGGDTCRTHWQNNRNAHGYQ